MLYRWLADLTAAAHLGFVVFVVLGGLLSLKHLRWSWVHVPAALWGVGIEWSGGTCPLTPLENWLRLKAGEAGYAGGFVEHYLLPVLYPADLTRTVQVLLGATALALNLVVYAIVWRRHRR
jgi:hypothetical protein